MKDKVRPGAGSSPSPAPGPRLYPYQEQFIRSCGERRKVVLLPITLTGRDATDWHRVIEAAQVMGFFK